MTDMEKANAQPASRRYRYLAIGAVALTSVIGAGTIAVAAGPMSGGPGIGHGHMSPVHMGWGGMGRGDRGDRAERHMERMFDAIDATPEQREQLQGIMDSAHEEMGAMFEEMRGTRAEMAELLGAAEIDRDAAEELRAERIAAMDDASERMLGSLLDAAEVLTPEQRVELIEMMEERGGRRGR